jgi:hypothetical protein
MPNVAQCDVISFEKSSSTHVPLKKFKEKLATSFASQHFVCVVNSLNFEFQGVSD